MITARGVEQRTQIYRRASQLDIYRAVRRGEITDEMTRARVASVYKAQAGLSTIALSAVADRNLPVFRAAVERTQELLYPDCNFVHPNDPAQRPRDFVYPLYRDDKGRERDEVERFFNRAVAISEGKARFRFTALMIGDGADQLDILENADGSLAMEAWYDVTEGSRQEEQFSQTWERIK